MSRYCMPTDIHVSTTYPGFSRLEPGFHAGNVRDHVGDAGAVLLQATLTVPECRLVNNTYLTLAGLERYLAQVDTYEAGRLAGLAQAANLACRGQTGVTEQRLAETEAALAETEAALAETEAALAASEAAQAETKSRLIAVFRELEELKALVREAFVHFFGRRRAHHEAA
jgi:hypothetical protein